MPGIEDRIADLERRLKQAKAPSSSAVARERAAKKSASAPRRPAARFWSARSSLAKVERGEWPKSACAS
ncbi:MAG: hypothetical protein IPI57_15170 [Candidatus Competibacteraceae bacterium]|nr:hypothetical protein [Candidatus Competibacteraceae bacterium]